jgi:hypothetical protein
VQLLHLPLPREVPLLVSMTKKDLLMEQQHLIELLLAISEKEALLWLLLQFLLMMT